jgi:acyl dehydratase
MPEIYLDDLQAGQTFALGGRSVSRKEIADFAKAWDPQPFHIDIDAARSGIYGDLIASGWHTVCIFMRLFVDGLLNRAAAIGSPGLDELRWLKPVYPGDHLDANVEILEVRPFRSKPDRGIAKIRCVVRNQQGEVLTMIASVMFLRRAAAAGAHER